MASSKRLAKTIWRTALTREKTLPQFLDNLTQVVKQYRLEYLLPSIGRYLELMARQTARERTLRITSSHDLSETSLSQIRQLVGATAEEKVETLVDQNVVGGFVAQYNHRVYDGSLRRNLSQIKEALTK